MSLDSFAGFFCEGPGEIDFASYPCPVGHYCPEGTTSDVQFACPGKIVNPCPAE